MAQTQGFEIDLAEAIKSITTFPEFPEGLSLEDGYDIQSRIVERVAGRNIAGLKGGATNAKMQSMLGIKDALIARLYEDGRLSPGAVLPYHPKVVLECEIGILIDASGSPKAAGPAIEVACMNFSKPEEMNGPNFVACNVAALQFIPGELQDWRDTYADIAITLTRDGETVLEGKPSDALGGPHEALAWMKKEAQARKISLADDMYLMTGACGGAIPAARGQYVADYGSLGRIEFSVE